jgi:hypothetical protein
MYFINIGPDFFILLSRQCPQYLIKRELHTDPQLNLNHLSHHFHIRLDSSPNCLFLPCLNLPNLPDYFGFRWKIRPLGNSEWSSTCGVGAWRHLCSHTGNKISSEIDAFKLENETEYELILDLSHPLKNQEWIIGFSFSQTNEDKRIESIKNLNLNSLSWPLKLSQMRITHPRAKHLCSPISLAMINGAITNLDQVSNLISDSFHLGHSMFGIWPQALFAANRVGLNGLTLLSPNFSYFHPKKFCVAVSIRFAEGELIGSPLNFTSGHFLVIQKISENHVYCLDPAASDHDQVNRIYDLSAFIRAWNNNSAPSYLFFLPD